MAAARNPIFHDDCPEFRPKLPARSANFVLIDPLYLACYKLRDGRTVPSGDNDTCLKPAFADTYHVSGCDRFCVRSWTLSDTLS
jgi:hypothetical protein